MTYTIQRMEKKMTVIHIKLSEEVRRKFKALCTLEGRNMQEDVAGYIEDRVARNEKKAK